MALSVWTDTAPTDWQSSTPVDHTNLNELNKAIRVVGYGLTAGTVTHNYNQNHIAALGIVTFHSSGYIAQDAWNVMDGLSGRPAMQNSWADIGVAQGYRAASYVKDKQRRVHIEMLLNPGTTNNPATSLPSGFRPAVAQRIHVYNASTGVMTMATVSTAGLITLLGSFSPGHFVHVWGSFPID
jgi:hypothetical protein